MKNMGAILMYKNASSVKMVIRIAGNVITLVNHGNVLAAFYGQAFSQNGTREPCTNN